MLEKWNVVKTALFHYSIIPTIDLKITFFID